MSHTFLHSLIARRIPGRWQKKVYDQLKSRYRLDTERFRGQRVLILGPARTVEDDLAELGKTEFENVVRMNNGIDTAVQVEGLDPLRCDTLFHSMTEDLRPLHAKKLKRAGTSLIVHRAPNPRAFRNTLQAAHNFATSDFPVPVRIIPFERYRQIRDMLGGHMPTTGMVCIDFFLRAPIEDLTIVGFTFFSTNYLSGYNDSDDCDGDSIRRVRRVGHHEPSAEAALLAQWILEARNDGKTVHLGQSVKNAMALLSKAM